MFKKKQFGTSASCVVKGVAPGFHAQKGVTNNKEACVVSCSSVKKCPFLKCFHSSCPNVKKADRKTMNVFNYHICVMT